MNPTYYDKLVEAIKNNKYLAFLLVIGAVIMAAPQILEGISSINNKIDGDDAKISLNYSIDNSEFPQKNILGDTVNEKDKGVYEKIKYSFSQVSNMIDIRPNLNPLNQFANNSIVQNFNPYSQLFYLQYPRVDLKVTNNSDKSIFFNKAEFIVEESSIDETPFLNLGNVSEVSDFEFSILKESWGEIKNMTVRFNLLPIDGQEDDFENNPFEVKIPDTELQKNIDSEDFNQNIVINFKYFLIKKGINISKLTSTECYKNRDAFFQEMKFLRPGKKYLSTILKQKSIDAVEILVRGKIIFDYIENNILKHKIVTFKTTSSIFLDGRGAAEDVSTNYNVIFKASSHKYTVTKDISQSLKSGDFDRFTFTIFSPKTSNHKFKIRLYYNDSDSFIDSPTVQLNVFSPVSYYLLRKWNSEN